MSAWKLGTACLTCGVLVCANRLAGADTVTLLSRKVYEGTIVAETADLISLETRIAGETIRLDFARQEVLAISKTSPEVNGGDSTARPRNVEVAPIDLPIQDATYSRIEIEGELRTSKEADGWHGVLAASIRVAAPRDAVWVISSGECERPTDGAFRIPVRNYWNGSFTSDRRKSGTNAPQSSASQRDAAARRELESKCRREIRDKLFEKETSENGNPIYCLSNDGSILMLRVVVVTEPGKPESILFRERGQFQITGEAHWIESPGVTQADLSRLAFTPRCRSNLIKVRELLVRIEADIKECREAGRAVPVFCDHCHGDGRLTGRDAASFTVRERAEWDRQVSAVAATQTGTGFVRATINVTCSQCGGSGRIGEREPTEEFKSVVKRRITLLMQWLDLNRSLQEECERELASVEKGEKLVEDEWNRSLADSARRTEMFEKLKPMLDASAEEIRRTPR